MADRTSSGGATSTSAIKASTASWTGSPLVNPLISSTGAPRRARHRSCSADSAADMRHHSSTHMSGWLSSAALPRTVASASALVAGSGYRALQEQEIELLARQGNSGPLVGVAATAGDEHRRAASLAADDWSKVRVREGWCLESAKRVRNCSFSGKVLIGTARLPLGRLCSLNLGRRHAARQVCAFRWRPQAVWRLRHAICGLGTGRRRAGAPHGPHLTCRPAHWCRGRRLWRRVLHLRGHRRRHYRQQRDWRSRARPCALHLRQRRRGQRGG